MQKFPVLLNRTYEFTCIEEELDSINLKLFKNPLRIISPVVGKGQKPVVLAKIPSIFFKDHLGSPGILCVNVDVISKDFRYYHVNQDGILVLLYDLIYKNEREKSLFLRGKQWYTESLQIRDDSEKPRKRPYKLKLIKDILDRCRVSDPYSKGFYYGILHEYRAIIDYNEKGSVNEA